jgi:hypothetical protein
MRELIGQRPNVIPAGLGNSETGFDSSVMLKHESDDDNHTGGINNLEIPAYDSDDEKSDASAATARTKRKAVVIKDEPKKCNKLMSGATQKSKPKSKPKSLIEKFGEVAELEEVTAQKRADAERARAAVDMARIKAEGEIRLEREKRKTEKQRMRAELLAMKRIKMEYDVAFQQMQMDRAGPSNIVSRAPSTFSYDGSSSEMSYAPDLSFNFDATS